MNSHLIYAKVFALVILFALSSCTAEHVSPAAQQDAPVLAADAGNNLPPVNQCSPRVDYDLADETGSLQVTYLNPGGNPGAAPNWGVVSFLNSDVEFVAEVDLASGWYIESVGVFTGNESALTLVDGNPQVSDNWFQADVNPLVNATQIRVAFSEIPNPCFNPTIVVEAVQFDMLGGIDPDSRTSLTLYNPAWNDATQPDLNTIGSAVTTWCNAPCD